jgi:hypothetical protein
MRIVRRNPALRRFGGDHYGPPPSTHNFPRTLAHLRYRGTLRGGPDVSLIYETVIAGGLTEVVVFVVKEFMEKVTTDRPIAVDIKILSR